MTIDEARERVERGAALLDAKQPGWREKVNPETLQMSSTCGCVLGQTFGDFIEGLTVMAIDLETDEDSRSGFDLGPEDTDAGYERLQAAWLEQLGAPTEGSTA